MLEKRSLGTLKRTNSEDSLNERFKENEIERLWINGKQVCEWCYWRIYRRNKGLKDLYVDDDFRLK